MKHNWSWALGLSIFIHALVLGGVPFFFADKAASPAFKRRELKMLPQDIEKIEKKNFPTPKAQYPKSVPPYIDNFMKKTMMDSRQRIFLDKAKIIEDNAKEIIVANIPKDKKLKKIPAYMEYYEKVSESIKRSAYYYYNNCADLDSGKIFVDFVILNNGCLESISLGEESQGSDTLKEITLRSVREASPFPPFTAELSEFVRIPFNTSIDFDIEFEEALWNN